MQIIRKLQTLVYGILPVVLIRALKKEKENITKAIVEAHCNLSLVPENNLHQAYHNTWTSKDIYHPNDHRNYWLHCRPIPPWILLNGKADKKFAGKNLQNFNVRRILEYPVQVVQVQHPKLIPLNFGQLEENFQRQLTMPLSSNKKVLIVFTPFRRRSQCRPGEKFYF